MDVSTTEWWITIGATCAILLFDVIMITRNPHKPSMKECGIALSVYVSLAIAFGIWVWTYHGSNFGLEFYAGWITEYSLSVDNLFIFIIIMASFNVPAKYQQEALMVGIILALILRGVFIALGAVIISNFAWVFYIFALFLLYTAWSLLKDTDDEEEGADNVVVRLARKRFTISEEWYGLKLFVRENGVRVMTPMFLVILALGTTDLIFALDSIPAIFGLTKEPYIVLTANIFALMGLRQLYFLLGGLVERLVFLSKGLAVVLAFIAVKLFLHAMHSNEVPFIYGGQNLPVPEIPTLFSLGFIIMTLIVTAVASLYHTRNRQGEDSRPS